MTHQCLKCKKSFSYKYLLEKHFNRKIKCKEPSSSQNSNEEFLCNKINSLDDKLQETNYELKETQNDLQDTKHTIDEISKKIDIETESCIKCLFCSKNFNTSKNLRRHIKLCKNKIDNIAIYEKELGLDIPNCNQLQCRFCYSTYTKQSNYSRHMNAGCKEKYKYELELQKTVINRRKEASAQIINNGDHATNIIINMPKIEMNPFGEENLDYITTKLLIKELESCKAIQQADVSGIVDRFTKLIHANPAHPENQNVLFKSLNTGFARVYRQNGFQDEQSTEVQDTIIQNVQKLIQTKGCDEYDYNSKTEFADVLDDIDVNYGKLNDSLEDGTNTRVLGKCRNTVKAALYSNKEEINTTQNLIEV